MTHYNLNFFNGVIFYKHIFLVYPAVTNSDDEDNTDVTWTPPSLGSSERVSRKHIRCLYPKVSEKKKRKHSKVTKSVITKHTVRSF